MKNPIAGRRRGLVFLIRRQINKQGNYDMNLMMMQQQPAQTMSSREMAQLCNKSHDNVLKLVRNLLSGGIVKNTTPHNYVHPQNKQTYVEFLSDKRDSLVIVARLSPEFTAHVIDRWQELESQVSTPTIPQTLPEALRLAADLAEKIEQQQAQLAIATPKAAALDLIDAAEGSLGIRETAKTIGIAQNKFVDWCINNNWMYRDTKGKLQPYSGRIQQDYMEQRPVTFNGRDGSARATTQPMFTPKGLARLAQIFSIVHEVA